MPPSVPSSTPNTPIIQYYPAPSHVPPPHYDPYPITVLVTSRRITIKTKGTLTTIRFQDEIYAPHGAQKFLDTLQFPTQSDTDSSLAYLDDLNTY